MGEREESWDRSGVVESAVMGWREAGGACVDD